ncbi:MAG: hypothetical protein EAZ73_25410 [Oscillatoriales cyanobacterium]|nr:MAG: hypothetical protein EAZ73_25410 [Oscillatoriales cyanobacterium]
MPLINLQPSGALRPELATDAEVAQAIAAHKAKVDEMISQSLIRTLSVMSRTGGNTGATIDANTTNNTLLVGKYMNQFFALPDRSKIYYRSQNNGIWVTWAALV